MRIDLHAHSTASDGTSTPADLVREAATAGLQVVAITDHDTTAGWAAASAALPDTLTLVPGAELSCRWAGTDGRRIGLHLLAYLFDPGEPALANEMVRVRASREARIERIVDLLRADGLAITWTEVLEHAAGGTVGRPHLAQALVRRGVVSSMAEAFTSTWLGERYRVPKDDIDVFTALRLVRTAGGVPVFAHPAASRRGPVVPEALIGEMAAHGLFGLEADHEDHSPVERAQIRALAAKLGLVVTGSSDYHGTNKTVRLGANTTSIEAFERIAAAATGCTPVTGNPVSPVRPEHPGSA
jgi:3',5'-nucleoside bisphosphate phosphatase